MLDRIITYSFYSLFLLTPLFWTSLNYELFEYNKMILVYGFTILIVGSWLLKIINHKSLIFNRTPLDIPLLLFLGANILSTIFSMDPHTSIWGYYSRSNGGLLSLISYLLLYWAFVSNMNKSQVLTTLKFGLLSGFIISVWGIFEHFGISPSCVILRGEFNASCWIQDVQSRVFATLGQPNWMAAYLSMLIFPALYFLLEAKSKLPLAAYYILLITYYLAFTFTYSRGPTLGLIAGMLVFILLSFPRKRESIQNIYGSRIKSGMTILLSFLLINLLFGSALTSFRLVSKFAPPPRPTINLPSNSTTQLETGGTESGQIRFIVWQGALEIFKHYPILGSGVETFAYSYYNFRPISHNLTSEWDFLYNKAHNEYLNYLATTGIVGFGAYSIIIITFITFILRAASPLKKHKPENLLIYSLLASYISYLVYNFFLFSVVAIALFFYLFPALVFVVTESTKGYRLQFTGFRHTRIAQGIVILSTLYLLFSIFQLWLADTIFAQGQKYSEAGNVGRAYNKMSEASKLNKGEPFFRSELAYTAAAAASALEEEDATTSGELKDKAAFEMAKVLKENPKNVSFWRTAVRTYFELALIDQTLQALDKVTSLAPTDPKPYYNKALILESIDKKEQALEALKKAVELKPNYLEAKERLDEINSKGN